MAEGILRRPVGGTAAMAGQLARLAEVSELPNVSLRVVPFRAGLHPVGLHYVSDPTRRPAGQAARLPAIPISEQRADEVPEASTVNDAAVAAYRLSVQAGNPLSERRLAQMFGRTSRRWARARIADARPTSSIQESPGPTRDPPRLSRPCS
ncbi:MAG TPA: Scr1 family TA system antitoxin-like transcriptional regulator [Streptosporangiaceae bacterium]